MHKHALADCLQPVMANGLSLSDRLAVVRPENAMRQGNVCLHRVKSCGSARAESAFDQVHQRGSVDGTNATLRVEKQAGLDINTCQACTRVSTLFRRTAIAYVAEMHRDQQSTRLPCLTCVCNMQCCRKARRLAARVSSK